MIQGTGRSEIGSFDALQDNLKPLLRESRDAIAALAWTAYAALQPAVALEKSKKRVSDHSTYITGRTVELPVFGAVTATRPSKLHILGVRVNEQHDVKRKGFRRVSKTTMVNITTQSRFENYDGLPLGSESTGSVSTLGLAHSPSIGVGPDAFMYRYERSRRSQDPAEVYGTVGTALEDMALVTCNKLAAGMLVAKIAHLAALPTSEAMLYDTTDAMKAIQQWEQASGVPYHMSPRVQDIIAL